MLCSAASLDRRETIFGAPTCKARVPPGLPLNAACGCTQFLPPFSLWDPVYEWRECLPSVFLKEPLLLHPPRDDASEQTPWDSTKEGCYQLPVSRGDILFLSTWEEVMACQEQLLQVRTSLPFSGCGAFFLA